MKIYLSNYHFIIGMKCLLSNQEIDEVHPEDHFAGSHGISSSQKGLLLYVFALQKKFEELEHKM